MSMTKPFLVAAIALAGAGTSLAQNPAYAPGDLVLYFQKLGTNAVVYANLGNTATLYRGAAAGPDAANSIEFLDVSAALTSAFGSDWATSGEVYAGLAGVWGTSNTSNLLQNGDPHRTLYVSSARSAVGNIGQANSNGWDLFFAGTTAMGTGASAMSTQNNIFETSYTTAVAVAPDGNSGGIKTQNPLTVVEDAVIQGNAFNNTFGGGVQQQGQESSFGNFGEAGQVEFALDLYRILARNNVVGQIGGEERVGSYEGTVTVGSNGKVSFISQGSATSSPYQSWVSNFPALDTEAKRLPSADPDNDGLTNLMEFVLSGNPGVADGGIRPVVSTTATDVLFNFNRRDEVVPGYTLKAQYGSNLTGWTDATIPAASGASGSATVTVTDGSGSDAISVSLPKNLATGGKLFVRLLVSENAP